MLRKTAGTASPSNLRAEHLSHIKGKTSYSTSAFQSHVSRMGVDVKGRSQSMSYSKLVSGLTTAVSEGHKVYCSRSCQMCTVPAVRTAMQGCINLLLHDDLRLTLIQETHLAHTHTHTPLHYILELTPAFTP